MGGQLFYRQPGHDRRLVPRLIFIFHGGDLCLHSRDPWALDLYGWVVRTADLLGCMCVCVCVYVSLLLSLSLSSVYVFLSRVCVLMCASLYVCSSELKQGCRIVASTGWSGRPQTQISIATCGQTDIIRGFTAPLPDGSIISVFQRSQVA